MATKASEKKELVKNQLQKLRKDLRVMHAGVTEEQTMPDTAEVKRIMSELESLLEVLETKSSRKKK